MPSVRASSGISSYWSGTYPGPDSIPLTGLLVGALLTNEHEFPSGVLVGVGLFKFQIVIPIALLFLLWRRWRFVSALSGCAMVLGSASVWLVGKEQSRQYVVSLFSMAGAIPPSAQLLHYAVPMQMMANFHGFIFGVSGGRIPQLWLQILTVLLSAAAVARTAFRGYDVSRTSRLLLLAIPCAILVSHYAFIVI